nr:hypothetical protein [Ectobacillus ponti]
MHPNVLKRLHHLVFVGNIVETNEKSFRIQCLSPIPKLITEAIAAEGNPVRLSGLRSLPQNEKVLRDAADLKASLFLFRLRHGNKHLYVELIAGKAEEAASFYEIVPAPYLGVGQTREMLERKLCKGYVSFLLPRYSSDLGMPELMYCQGRLYGRLSLKSTVSSIMYREQHRNVVYYDIEDWDAYVSWNVDDALYFIQKDHYDMMREETEKQGERLIMPDVKQRAPAEGADTHGEAAFLRQLQLQTREKGLYLELTDMINFHTCVKTGRITIVGGMPGIGKSKFVKVYAEAMGLRHGRELLWLPISPSFQEPQDLLGYGHPNGSFIQSETGLVPFLLEAERHPEQLYMVVFDEMNISHVEHWFTPFLSLLELEPEARMLKLHALADSEVPQQVTIGNNVIFVGTVNFDETTKELSDRLLDRVNMVTFEKPPFREAFVTAGARRETEPLRSFNGLFAQWSRTDDSLSFTEEELELLDALHACLQKHDAAKGVSFRAAAAIGSYLANLPKDEDGNWLISREEAFDLQVKQRILTKIRGLEHAVAPLVQERGRREESLPELLQSPLAQDVSTFTHSLALLRQKARELELYGYAK